MVIATSSLAQTCPAVWWVDTRTVSAAGWLDREAQPATFRPADCSQSGSSSSGSFPEGDLGLHSLKDEEKRLKQVVRSRS